MSEIASGAPPKPRHNRILLFIAFIKLVKAGLMIAAGLGVFRLLDPAFVKRVQDVVAAIASPFFRHRLEILLGTATDLRPGQIKALGVGALLYASLFLVEGIGLALERRWAEYLTVVATGLLIPIEAWELGRRITSLRLAALALNVAIVIYLIQMLRRDREPRGT